ncbi:MAG TPA: EAL domain-containing protein [Candidatus Limnocylindrales bacterium]
MSNTHAPETGLHPVRATANPPLRPTRSLMASVAPRLDPVVLAAVLWMIGYLFFAVTAGRQLNGHSSTSDLWLLPADMAFGLIALLLVRDSRPAGRDRIPWSLILIAGLTLPVADGLWLAADPRLGLISGEVAAITNLIPFIPLGAAALLFRRAVGIRSRPRTQYLLDLAGIVLVAGITIWYLVQESTSASSGADIASWITYGGAALLAIAIVARIALRPTEGLSRSSATVLAIGAASAILGAVVTSGPVPATNAAATAGQILLAVFRCALIIGLRLEMRARAQRPTLLREGGPSPLFYASIAVGSAVLAILVIDLGERYLILAVICVFLIGIMVVRQFFTVRDVIQADAAQRKTEARFGWLVRNSSDFIMAVDAEGTIEYVSPSVERLLCLPAHALLGTALTTLAHPDDTTAIGSLIQRAMASSGRGVSGEWRISQPDGTWLPVETVACTGTGDLGANGVVLNTRDLRERKALEQKLTFQAFHDPLTRLANRSLFRERVEHALDRRAATDTAVLFIDLDNFKTINDSLGHAAGDHVLVETAHRLRSSLRGEDTAARLGGDEFAVLLEDADVTGAARIAERIRLALGTPFWVLGQEVYISASIGIAIRRENDSAGELLRNADVAMYTAKSKGKACFEIFEPAMHDAVVARLGLEAELRRAIERQEFVVYYQPIVRLETAEIIGAEALVRWLHPTRGIVPPLEFIPLAEETGLIVPLGGWILREACHQLAEWQRLRGGGEPFVMNVNLSSRQLVREAIADEVAAAVDESGIRASWLVLEVTETVLMADPVAAAAALGHIRDLGVRVALDDFGSGYSSLSHLRRFPIDIVKIDKSFVDDVAHAGTESAIARGIIQLGRAMNIQTVAEGIEGDEQAEVLRTLGCELGQGFFFAKPLAPESWADLLGTDSVADGGPAGSPKSSLGPNPAGIAASTEAIDDNPAAKGTPRGLHGGKNRQSEAA